MSNEHRIPPWDTIRVTPPPRVAPPTTGEHQTAVGAEALGANTTGANNPMLAVLAWLGGDRLIGAPPRVEIAEAEDDEEATRWTGDAICQFRPGDNVALGQEHVHLWESPNAHFLWGSPVASSPRVVPSGRSRPHRGPRLTYPPSVQAATGRVLTPLAGLLLAFGVGCAFWALAALLLWWVLS